MNHVLPRQSLTVRLAVPALLAIHAVLVAWVGFVNSPTIDEVGHLPAGISHWQFGRFDLYRVNPPLVRSIAAVPVLLCDWSIDWRHYDQHPQARPEFAVGTDFIRANGARSFRLFMLARWACIPLSLLGGWVCFRWAAELYGATCGLLALALWCFCPNVIANSAQITPDAGAAALGCLAGYSFWKWLCHPSWNRALISGFALGLAQLSKTTWLLLFGLWPLLWLIRTMMSGRRGRAIAIEAGHLGATLALGIWLINLGYGFEGSGKRIGDFLFVSRALGGHEAGSRESGNRFAGSWLGRIPVPLPENYVYGIDVQKREFEQGKWSYLCGEQRREGWWYYYLYALAVKVPLGTWLLACLAIVVSLRDWGRVRLRDEIVLLVPALAVLVLVSSQTGINRYLRYVLPAFPFAFIWISKAGSAIDGRRLRTAVLPSVAIACSAASSLSVYPHSLSYFNELAGGPTSGHAHLLDANIDWGQDLLHLKRWLDAHPEVENLRLAYFGFVDPKVAGIEAEWPPRGSVEGETVGGAAADFGPQPGWFAVSVNFVYGYRHLESDRPYYTYFQRFTPVAMAGYSIYIYCISAEEAKRVRREMGLPVLEDEPVEVSGEY